MAEIPNAAHAGWQWPADLASDLPKQHSPPGTFKDEHEEPHAKKERSPPEEHPEQHPEEHAAPPPRRRHYKPRQCRICLEEVLPSFETPAEGIGAYFNPAPKVTYVSSDPESGRLLRPCKCRGSQAYVHEGCLQAWRHADPRYGDRNFWDCPTCKFRYRLERMKWSRIISSTLAQIGLTTLIMLSAVFLLGFVADPIINLYFEPGATLVGVATGNGLGQVEMQEELEGFDGWVMHFLKGLTSIGLLGFVKVIWAISPFNWFNLRGTGGLLGGGGRNARVGVGVTGRERSENTFWLVVIIGLITFLVAIWTWVRRWSRATLEKAGERVIDVNGDDDFDEEEDDEDETAPQPSPAANAQPENIPSRDLPGSSRGEMESRKTQ